MRRATDPDGTIANYVYISTHALREEGDLWKFTPPVMSTDISTHALREEGDLVI